MPSSPQAHSAEIKPTVFLLDQKPNTLNPRQTIDAQGQRLSALLFRGLTQIDENLEVQPGLATSWKADPESKVWKFKLATDLKDHANQPILATQIAACLEQYRMGKPVSLAAKGFRDWKSTEWNPTTRELIIRLESGDPYFPRNASLLRFFRSDHSEPCGEPKNGESVATSGDYSFKPFQLFPETEVTLTPVDSRHIPVTFRWIRDEKTRVLTLIKGEADFTQNTVSLTKTRWLQKEYASDFAVLERPGVTVSYLAFNLKDPILKDQRVRKAIAHAIDRKTFVEQKMFGFGRVAESLLSPLLPEAAPQPLAYDPKLSESLLDQAGFKKGRDGTRIHLTYKTTSVREGYETALVIRSMLQKIGIALKLEVVESSVLLDSVRKGNYQMHSSRWVGIADASILGNTLHSKEVNNRWFYRNPQVDTWIDQASATNVISERQKLYIQIQEQAMKDLPYLPLWFWSNAAVIRRSHPAARMNASQLSLSGAFEPLLRTQGPNP